MATLLVSPQPLRPSNIDTVERVAEEYGFTILHSPRRQSAESRIRAILAATDEQQLLAATELEDLGIVAAGNLLATYTLMLLCGLALAGVMLEIFVPLQIAGRPQIPNRVFLSGLAYFACIGTGFVMVQIPLM